MARIIATRRSGLAHDVEVCGHRLISDEPTDNGGADEGPSPTGMLAASLAACTAITMEMYADRKGWDLPECRVEIDARGSLVKGDASYEVTIHLPGGLTEEQTQRLTTIAGKCPVHKAIARETPVSISSRIEA